MLSLSVNFESYAQRTSFALACTGQDYDMIHAFFPEWKNYLVTNGFVLARMKPENKAQFIEDLSDVGYITAMVGDGSNDCNALKRAHVGISLSELEASVASPFTSQNPDISCVEKLIREGRCSLVTGSVLKSFTSFFE